MKDLNVRERTTSDLLSMFAGGEYLNGQLFDDAELDLGGLSESEIVVAVAKALIVIGDEIDRRIPIPVPAGSMPPIWRSPRSGETP